MPELLLVAVVAVVAVVGITRLVKITSLGLVAEAVEASRVMPQTVLVALLAQHYGALQDTQPLLEGLEH
jgi:hypothetical protein